MAQSPDRLAPSQYLDKIIAVVEKFKSVQDRASETFDTGDAVAAYAKVDELLRAVAWELELKTD